MSTQSRSRHLHNEIKLAWIPWVMIFERNDAVVDIVWKRISPDFSFRSCLFVAALQWTHADVPILYENTHWLQWRMKIASIFVESNFQIRSAFLWPSLSRCDEVMRNTYLFSASIFTFIGGSPKKPSDALSLCWRSPSSSQWRNCYEGNLKNTKTFLVFLFVNFIYKLPHNSRARLHGWRTQQPASESSTTNLCEQWNVFLGIVMHSIWIHMRMREYLVVVDFVWLFHSRFAFMCANTGVFESPTRRNMWTRLCDVVAHKIQICSRDMENRMWNILI